MVFLSLFRQFAFAPSNDTKPEVIVVGDVHGCHDEMLALLERCGYRVGRAEDKERFSVVLVGDLVSKVRTRECHLFWRMPFVQKNVASFLERDRVECWNPLSSQHGCVILSDRMQWGRALQQLHLRLTSSSCILRFVCVYF